MRNIRFVEVTQVAVDSTLWEKAKKGDEGAKKEIRRKTESAYLYCHGLSVFENDIIIDLKELDEVIPGLGVKIEYEEGRF